MEQNPVIKNITIYPIKSLDGISLQKAQLCSGGCLLHDREFAIVDSNDKYVNGKSNALVHLLRSEIDFDNETVLFKHDTDAVWNKFHLQKEKAVVDEYLTDFFKKPVRLLRNTEGKFLDVPVKSGITVLSTASLETVGGWFNNMPLEETRKRFRATIEIDQVPAFWEDKLFYDEGTAIEFSIGNTIVYGMGPRARCVVPTRHPQSGDMIHGFQKSFANQRALELPGWSTLDNYGHTYYLSVDCYIPPSEFGKWIETGDEIKITGKKITT